MYERWREIKAERAMPGSCIRTAVRLTLAEVAVGRDSQGVRIDPDHVRRAEALVRNRSRVPAPVARDAQMSRD